MKRKAGSIAVVALAFCAFFAAAATVTTWNVGPLLLTPGPAGSFDSIAVKDPSIVHFKDKWHVFYTARDRNGYTLGYVAAPHLSLLSKSRRVPLVQAHASKSKYAAAPQVFLFRPQSKWYLIYQTTDSNYLPAYSTTDNIDDPASWSEAKPLVDKKDRSKWIDFWVICDETTAYLFFTRDQQEVMQMSTPIDQFPSGFSNLRRVFAPVHEAVHVYSTSTSGSSYAMLFEQQEKGIRHFGLARAGNLRGPWKLESEHFAGGSQLIYHSGVSHWTDEVSHGELIREGFDERLLVSPQNWRLLMQGLPESEHKGEYTQLPWRLGIIAQPN